MSCPASERLIEFVDGRLDDIAQREIEAHIDQCEGCRTAMGAIVAGEQPAWALGRYRIDGVLGAGGMGIVYRGWDPSLARPVAVKVVRTGGDDTLRSRLAREAQSLARLNHPNVCQVYDVGNDSDELWIAMELVDGVTLRAWLAGTASRDDTLRVLAAAGRGLAAAHAAGLVHRDVKPENVLVDKSGRAVVTDFGLARITDAASATRTSVLAGTPAYMAPEQLDGTPADARTDQYAFAVMAHEALTGARPRPRNVASAALPAGFRAVLTRALSDEPADRYPSMPALLDAITQATRPRRRWPIAVASVALLAFGGGTFVVVATNRSSREVGEAPTVAAREIVPSPLPSPSPSTPDAATATPPEAPDAATEPPPVRTAKRTNVAVGTTPRDGGVIRPRDTAPRAPVTADAAEPEAIAATRPPSKPSGELPVPRLGTTVNAKNHTKRVTTLADAEDVFSSGYCHLPGMVSKVNEHSLPVDWGKVTRVADVVGLSKTGSPMDLRLYDIAGQRRRYVINGYWGSARHGELGAKVGELVAICPRDDEDTDYQLPEGWQVPITRHHVAVRVGGPPDRRGLPILSWSHINATNADQKWPYGERALVYGQTGGKLNNGRFMMAGWQLEVDDATKIPLDLHRGAWIVVDKPRWVPSTKDRTMVVLHAVEMRATLFPPAP